MRWRIQYFSWRHEWQLATIVAAILLIVYWYSMPPGVTFEDTGMISAICYNFGLLHPPGYPLYSLLCLPFARLSDIMPLNPAQATALLSALAAALTCMLFYEIARRFGALSWTAAAAALGLGLGARFWSQAIIPEVYTFNTLLVAATWVLILRILRAPTRRRIGVLLLLGGLGLSNHWPLYVINAPAFILFLAQRRLFNIRLWARGLGMLALGLLPYGYLLLRPYWQSPLSLFPPPADWSTVLAYISRQPYVERAATLIVPEWTECAQNAFWGVHLLSAEYALPGVLLAVFGAVVFYRRRPLLWSIGVLWGIIASAPLLSAYLCLGGDGLVERTVFAAYPLPAMIFLMLFITAALNRLPKPINIVTALVFVIFVGANNWQDNNRASDYFAEDYAATILSVLPPGASLLQARDFDFPVFYRHYALGERPDIMLVRTVPKIASDGGRFFYTEHSVQGNYDDWGILRERQPPGVLPMLSPLPLPLIDFYRRLPQWYGEFEDETRQWDKVGLRLAIFNAARALTIAAHERDLIAAEKSALAAIIKTPEGLFGQLTARLQGRAGRISNTEIRETLAILLADEHQFFPDWRSQLLHQAGVLDFLAGRYRQARQKWEEALALSPAVDNLVLIDLLQLLELNGEWAEYAAIRKKYWRLNNPVLDNSDARCRAAGFCASLARDNR